MKSQEELLLGNHKIGPSHKPFIIAEMSGNHNQSLEKAFQIVDAAAATGVQALKIQTYTADSMTLNLNKSEFVIQDSKSLWNGRKLYDLYQEAATPYKWHKPIFDRCRQKGILGFSTPFDAGAVDLLESLNVPFYKLASFEMTDIPLLKKIALTGKPIIISTGMATVAEIDESVRALREAGHEKFVLLKCTSTYPASPENSNLATLRHMSELFQCHVGLSDHTLGIGVSVAAIAMGAVIIEKHFTLSRAAGGVDSAFSMEPSEMHALVEETKRAWQSVGKISYGPSEKEKASLQFRRSVYVAKNMKAGEEFTHENLRCIRPGFGLAPKYFESLLGRKARTDISEGTAMNWDLV